ncbi:hypothetical protein J6590_095412 [Homalodisca vitripennis]|nr:hypothetical protein J6590_095412 [Homalodisca vitripennis]
MPYKGRYHSPLPLVTRQTDTALSIPTICKRLINPHMASTPHVLYPAVYGSLPVTATARYRQTDTALSIPTICKRLINPHMASTLHVLYSCRIRVATGHRYRSLLGRPTLQSLDSDDMQTTDKSSHGEYSTCDILMPYTGRYRSPLPLVTRQTDTALSIPTICKRLINPHMASTATCVTSCAHATELTLQAEQEKRYTP